MRAGGPAGPGAFVLKSENFLDASLAHYEVHRKGDDVQIFLHNLFSKFLLARCEDGGFFIF